MIDPELQPFLAVWAEKWARLAPGASAAERRAHFETVAREMRLPTPEGVETGAEHRVASPAGEVRVRVFRADGAEPQPGLVYLHGGGWMQGSPETHWDITARIAAANHQTVLSVDYALAPEHPFPAALRQCEAVVAWAFDEAEALGLDARRISVGGDSAGGNLAAALCLVFRGSARRIAGQLLVYPATDFDMTRPSIRENPDGPIIVPASMPATHAAYCPTPEDLDNPLAAPLLAADHRGLPPAYVAVAEHDPLRDSGRAYAAKLRTAGVPVELDEGPGLIHGYLRALGYCRASRERLAAIRAWLDRVNQGSLQAAG